MSKGLDVGATLPDFELPDENGVTHKLSELQQVAMRAYADFDPTEPEVRDKWESEQHAAAAA